MLFVAKTTLVDDTPLKTDRLITIELEYRTNAPTPSKLVTLSITESDISILPTPESRICPSIRVRVEFTIARELSDTANR
jgi:hypothetical protein